MKNGDIKPDTHCFDEDEQKDVWSYSEALIAQIRAEDQARIRELEEALERIADTDPDDGTAWFHAVADKALSKPSDYSALNEALARECERLSVVLSLMAQDERERKQYILADRYDDFGLHLGLTEAAAHRAKGGV